MLDAARRAKTTLYVITAFYVAVGFFVAVPAAVGGDRLSAFLGFLIISGALACAYILRSMLRLTAHVCATTETMGAITDTLERLTGAVESLAEATHESASTRLLDLAAFGRGDPDVLAAARLDRDAYPRLVSTMSDEPPAEAEEVSTPQPSKAGARPDAVAPRPAVGTRPQARSQVHSDAARTGANTEVPDAASKGASASLVTTKNLLDEWKVGLRNGDLVACRAVYAALVDLVEPVALAPLTKQLKMLTEQTEQALRRLFTDCAHRHDIEGMLEIGERILRLLPDRPVAGEFHRLKPLLRLKLETDFPVIPPLRLVH